ncbi:MAG: COR domain-containing protein, partial [Cyanobacteria bacterium J06627_8]
ALSIGKHNSNFSIMLMMTEFKGVLKRRLLSDILDRTSYPRDKHRFIINMMEKFELCFPMDSADDKQFLIPDLLPKEEPYTGDWEDALAFEYHYPVLPSSVMSRFIVRMHLLIRQSTYWRNGVVLEADGSIALVKADREDKKIFIRITGNPNTRRSLLGAIRTQFRSIHNTIKGISDEVQERVPLPNQPHVPPISYDHLLMLESKGISEFIPEGHNEAVSVKALLDGIEPQGSRQSLVERIPSQQRSATPKKPASKEIFVSYNWSEESKAIVDLLDEEFQRRGVTIIRDNRDVTYKDRIRAFMRQLGAGKAIIAVISEKYLESESCMFELIEIARNGNFYDRIFPIVLKDAQIFKPIKRIRYVRYWEEQISELNEAMQSVGQANLQGFRDDIDFYHKIRATVAELTNTLKDMNALTPEMHQDSNFDELFTAVMEKINE